MKTYNNRDGSISIILTDGERLNIINPLVDEIYYVCSVDNILHGSFLVYDDIKKIKHKQKILKTLAKNLKEVRDNVDKL